MQGNEAPSNHKKKKKKKKKKAAAAIPETESPFVPVSTTVEELPGDLQRRCALPAVPP
jgi:hypothetical protein